MTPWRTPSNGPRGATPALRRWPVWATGSQKGRGKRSSDGASSRANSRPMRAWAEGLLQAPPRAARRDPDDVDCAMHASRAIESHLRVADERRVSEGPPSDRRRGMRFRRRTRLVATRGGEGRATPAKSLSAARSTGATPPRSAHEVGARTGSVFRGCFLFGCEHGVERVRQRHAPVMGGRFESAAGPLNAIRGDGVSYILGSGR